MLLDVGNPNYWVTKAIENLTMAQKTMDYGLLTEAVTLILITKATLNGQKARNNIADADNELS